MFQGTQGNINVSTSASLNESSFFNQTDLEQNLKNFANPLVGKMPKGHEGYTEEDKNLCPVLSGKIKPPVQQEADQDDDSDTSSDESEDEMPVGHEGFSQEDKDKCPVMSGKIKMPPGVGQEMNKKKKKKKIQSGCPVMPAENKKSPGLSHLEPSYEVPYISTLRHLFTFGGPLQKGKTCPPREMFDSYPLFLKHTLFHDQDKLKNIRKMEMTQRFFVYDDFRVQGNKKYHRKRFNDAIGFYEHALSCFKWLEIKKEEKKPKEETKEEEPEFDPLASLKPLNRALVTVMTDENVELHDGEDVTEKSDADLRTSMLLNIYLGLACVYLQLNHYSEAIIAVNEGIKLTDTSSQLYLRRSQARAYNKGSTLADLYKAKEDIEKAIDMKREEKIFQQEPSVLKILNVHNAGEIYVEHAHYVDKLIKEKQAEMKAGLKGFFAKLKEIEFVEEAMEQEGKTFIEKEEEHTVEIAAEEENMEVDLIKEMTSKYYKIIEFYIETDKKDQIAIARKELQTVLEARTKMQMFLGFDFKNHENDPILTELAKDHSIDMSKPKVQKRLEKMRINKVKDIFENGHFNLEVFQYAFKDLSRKRQEREKLKKAKAKQFDAEKPKEKWLKKILGAELGIQILILVFLFGVFWHWNKNSFFGSNNS